jgi:choline dehydrogenase-like flavoprotein
VETVDICIIGSGFGGAISAARLAEQCARRGIRARIRVLEKGHDFFDFDPRTLWKYRNAQGNGFKQTLALDYFGEISTACTDPLEADPLNDKMPSFNIAAGKGIGGSSLLYYAVSLRAPARIFDQTEAGRRLWPAEYTRSRLNPYFARVEQMLKVSRMAWSTSQGVPPWQLCTKRDYVFAEGCLKIGATSEPLKIATQNDANEGWWLTGQRFAGRQHLPLNYLDVARRHGVEFHSECEVQSIAPDGNSGYTVSFYDKRSERNETLECKLLVLAGGTVGSTAILLKSRDNFEGARALSDDLGYHVSANGDYALTGIVGPQYQVESYKGKPMSSICASFWNDHQYNLIPFYTPPLLMAFGQPAELAVPKNPAAVGRRSTEPSAQALWGKRYKEVFKAFGNRILTVGVLTLDRCEGVITQGLDGSVVSRWPTTHPDTEGRWSHAVGKVRSIFNALGGELYTDFYRHRGTVGTVHPLGGCRMGPNQDQGVVDGRGEVFGNRNLFVIDGAMIPSALGVNPSLTIGAVSEYVCEAMADSLADRLG